MKKILLCALAGFLFISCGKGTFKVTGEFPDAESDGKMAYLINYDLGDTIDSAMVKGNKLEFVGEIEAPIMARLLLDGPKMTFVLENSEILLNLKDKVVTGGELNAKLSKLRDNENKLEEEFEAIMSDTATTETAKELTSNVFTQKVEDLYKTTYNENKENPVGYFAFLQYTYSFTSAQIDSIMQTAPKSYADRKRIKTWIESAKKKDVTAICKKFVDFTVKSEDGQETKLSDFVGKGKYVLVDFWASWCGPCIRETEVIKEINKEYSAKGLQILGVAVWDEPANTMKAVESHKIPWQQIINAKSIPTDAYGITGIPYIILFGPDGTILSRGLQGDKLKAKVKEIIK